MHEKGIIVAAVLFLLVAIPMFNTTGNVAAGCHDTDGGLNYQIKGAVNTGTETLYDHCVGEKVVEYYCANDQAQLTIHDCPKYCVGGRCVE